MREMGYHICLYDPFFWPSLEVLDERYDFVVACEVIEHFFDPADEFTRLHGLLKSGGTLVLNTHVYTPNIDFESWYYRRDPTHVSFYSARTFEWIRRYFSFASLDVGLRVVTMQTFVAD